MEQSETAQEQAEPTQEQLEHSLEKAETVHEQIETTRFLFETAWEQTGTIWETLRFYKEVKMPGWSKIPRKKIEDLITLIDDIIAGDQKNQNEWALHDPSRAELQALRDHLQALLDDRQAKYAAWREAVAAARDGVREAIPVVRRAIDKCRAYWGRSNPRLLDYNIAPYKLRTPAEIPAAPESITAEPAGDGKIFVDWSNVDGARFYEVWRAEEDPQKPAEKLHFELLKTLTRTRFTDSGLEAGIRYYYKIRAGNSAGMGDFSAVAECIAT